MEDENKRQQILFYVCSLEKKESKGKERKEKKRNGLWSSDAFNTRLVMLDDVSFLLCHTDVNIISCSSDIYKI